ncbi:glycosyltransferase [Paraburkholderia sediminicola]|uniref:glycosyltransferase n=1 Tax=Paraburkholderia sediminicola TaxID=458836 RepID=UPI0038B9D714
MKIVHVIESSATGTLSMVRLIANGLADCGLDVHVIYSRRPETPENFNALFDERVKLHHVQMGGKPPWLAALRLRAMLREISPNVVHLHSSYAGFLGRIGSLLGSPGVRFLYSPHCISFMRQDISTWKRLAFIALERIGTLKSCLYVACSESERIAVKKHLGMSAVLLENAVSGRDYFAANLGRAKRDYTEVVCVGGIRRQKNPRLFAQIAARMDAERFRFKWIGDGDDEAKGPLIQAGVAITGWLSTEQTLKEVSEADVYLSTSDWEGMPVSVIEAMLMGKPSVVSRCAGNVDAVSHLRTGVVYETVDEAVDWVTRLASDTAFSSAVGTSAREEALDRFGLDRFFKQLMQTYRLQT